MKALIKFGYAILDSCFSWFTPSWRRKGCDALSAITRYDNHFSHKFKPERSEKVNDLKSRLEAALYAWDKDATVKITEELENLGEAMPGFKRNPLAEMVESFMVIMVIFLGLRTYYVQPFRIPTGSMRPTLNGIIIHPIDEVPSAPTRWWHAITLGSSYVDAVADRNKTVTAIRQDTWLLFFTETVLTFDGDPNDTLTIPCAQGEVMQYFRDHGKSIVFTDARGGVKGIPFKQGETIMRARVDAGDMVLVNRASYHFRKPQRGETFVFDTRGINTKGETARYQDQSSGTHYIKRLCGLPGDSLEIRDPELLVNGRPAQESTIRRVMDGKDPYNPEGYEAVNGIGFLSRNNGIPHMGKTYLGAGQVLVLKNPEDNPNMREYAALGDNTTNSLDSRYWGPVHQYNILGPAVFTLWPFTSHWGSIE